MKKANLKEAFQILQIYKVIKRALHTTLCHYIWNFRWNWQCTRKTLLTRLTQEEREMWIVLNLLKIEILSVNKLSPKDCKQEYLLLLLFKIVQQSSPVKKGKKIKNIRKGNNFLRFILLFFRFSNMLEALRIPAFKMAYNCAST